MPDPTNDIHYARRAIELAAGGIGCVSPNPLVGCLIVNDGGDVVGEGTYLYDGVTHAEVIALEQAGEAARGATAYVSLEPHAHHGKTPPCTQALIDAGVARVVCPIEDPNPLVSGRGVDALRAAGVEVSVGLLADEAALLNEKFIAWHKLGRPFVHLKIATSLDGRISISESVSTALSGEGGLKRVHELRHEHDAILIGANTVVVDDPSLTDRSGRERRRPLVRVILDNRLRTPYDSQLVRTAGDVPTLIFTNSRDREAIGRLRDAGCDVDVSEMGGRDLSHVLATLAARDLQSVLVEGGSEIAGSFCDAGLVDKVTFLMSPLIIGGREAPVSIGGAGPESIDSAMRVAGAQITLHGEDIEITGYPLTS